MKDVNQIKAIEEINRRYLELYHSPNTRLFRNFNRLKKLPLKDRLRLIKKKTRAKIGDIYIKKYVKPKENEKFYYTFGKPLEKEKIAVYSCVTNGYDNPKTPLYISNDTDYFLYTDNLKDKINVWKKQKIDCQNYVGDENRFYKFHPDILSKKYDFAIYIDGNVEIVSDVTTICSIARQSKIGIAMHRHHERDCVYQEGLACKYYKRGNYEKIEKSLEEMHKDNFPEKFGLCEATVIVYDLKNPLSKKIAHEWWKMYYDSGTKRDQIFFPYIIWKIGYNMTDVGDLGNNIWKNPKFILHGHK